MYGKRWVLKFSPTWEVEGELDLLIRESAPPLGKRVRRGAVHACSSSSAATRSLRRDARESSQPCDASQISQFGSFPDRGLL